MNPISSIYNDEDESKNKLLEHYYQMLQKQIFENKRLTCPAEEAKETYAPKEDDKKDNPYEDPADKNREDRWIKIPNDKSQQEDSGIYGSELKYKSELNTKEASLNSQKGELSPEDEDLLRRLRARDQEVRTHEMAHAAALGRFCGVIRYTYQLGPDGRLYAIGGTTEVAAGSLNEDDAKARAEAIRKAAGVVSDPSNADIAAALDASQQENKLKSKLPFG